MNSLSSVSKTSLAGYLILGLGLAIAALAGPLSIAGALGLVVALLALAQIFWMRKVLRQVAKALTALSQAAEGHLSVRVLNINGSGTLSAMLRSLNRLLDQTEAFAKEANDAMKAGAEGRYYRHIIVKGLRGEFAQYAVRVNQALDVMAGNAAKLGELNKRILESSVNISVTVNEGAMANARITSGIRMARDEAQGMAAATEEMVASVQEISLRSEEAANLSSEARTMTEDGQQSMNSAMSEFQAIESTVNDAAGRVAALARASEAIVDILSSIEEIAAQTNLLALNATIEAARAGDAGKGFAVVANEVKVLSNQTARATEDIGRRVSNLREEMEGISASMHRGTEAIAKGRHAMEEMGERMSGIGQLVRETTTRMEDVSSILSQQTAASKEISDGVQHVAAQASNNVEAIDQSSGALDTVEKQVSHLLELLSTDDSPERTLLMAKVDHVMWRRRLIDMLVGRVDLQAEGAADEHSCRLGKWYHGPEGQSYAAHPAFREMEEPHRVVHQAGLAAIRAHKERRPVEAQELFDQMDKASNMVLKCLDRLVAEPA